MPRCQSISCGERQGVAAAGGGARSRRGGGGGADGRMSTAAQQVAAAANASRKRPAASPVARAYRPRAPLLQRLWLRHPGGPHLLHQPCHDCAAGARRGSHDDRPAAFRHDPLRSVAWAGGGGGGHCCSGVPAGGGGDVSRMQHARFCCSPSARAPWAPQSTTCSRLTATAAPPSTTRRLSSHPPCCAGGWVSALSPFLIVAFNTGACVGVHRGGCFSVGTQEVCTGPIAVLAVVDASLSECRGPPTALCVLGDPLLACGLACPMTGCHHAPS